MNKKTSEAKNLKLIAAEVCVKNTKHNNWLKESPDSFVQDGRHSYITSVYWWWAVIFGHIDQVYAQKIHGTTYTRA